MNEFIHEKDRIPNIRLFFFTLASIALIKVGYMAGPKARKLGSGLVT